ncbi:hypothetical protein TB2_008687 [Malus domestica]
MAQEHRSCIKIHLPSIWNYVKLCKGIVPTFECRWCSHLRLYRHPGQDGCTNFMRASPGHLPGVVKCTNRIHTARITAIQSNNRFVFRKRNLFAFLAGFM